ncbi:MAG TPA: CotH kinase family protein [Polyangia bacterium]
MSRKIAAVHWRSFRKLALGGALALVSCAEGAGGPPGGGAGSGGSGGFNNNTGGSAGAPATGGRGGGTGGVDAAPMPGKDGATTPSPPVGGNDASMPPPPSASSDPNDDSWLKRVVPVVWLEVGGKTLHRTSDTPGSLKVIEQHEGKSLLTGLDGLPIAAESKMMIHIRGFSSGYLYNQKPYSIDFVDDAGMDRKVSLLGLPQDAEWALASCFSDKSCVRNALAYWIGREMNKGTTHWTPRLRYVEVYLDGQYRGLYQLVERIKGSNGRMNLDRPAETAAAGDQSGAYVIQSYGDQATYKDAPKDDTREFFDGVGSQLRWRYVFPGPKTITAEQKTFVQKAFSDMHNGLISQSPQVPKGAWKERFDQRSWQQYFLAAELSNNADAFYRSFHVHKMPQAKGGKWHLGPLWDYDIAFGNIDYGQRFCANTSILATTPNSFQVPLNGDQEFQNEMKCRWYELRKEGGPFDGKRLEAYLDAIVAHIKAAKTRDSTLWPMDIYTWPNNYVGGSLENEVAYLKYWIRKRINWMDTTLKGTCTTVPAPAKLAPLTAPAPVADDKRLQTAMQKPPQYHPGFDGAKYQPIDSPACPPWPAGL